MNDSNKLSDVLEVASEAGHILLENGAEISRVEDIMSRISTHYGVDSGNFFVLSNGIFTTGKMAKIPKEGGQSETYANVEFIPIKGIQLSKVSAVNRLSYDIASNKFSLEEARKRLDAIRAMPAKPYWEQIVGAALGAAGFCAVFGGGILDCAAAFFVGLLLSVFCIFVSSRLLSRIVGGISNALVAMALSLVLFRCGFGDSLSNIIIGSIMPLVPGVPFVNGVRDLANSDYLAGLTRLTDAMLGFLCIAIGVSVGFLLDGWIFGGVMPLAGLTASAETSGLIFQTIAAFVGTFAFAILFDVPRRLYLASGLIGAAGWCSFLILTRFAGSSPTVAIVISTVLVCVCSRFAAVLQKCPSTVFLLCGIFPLVPGAGIFWFTYYLITSSFRLSFASGFVAGKAAVAIVIGIILAMELPQRLFSWVKRCK